MTRLTISRDAPTTLAMSWRETLSRMICTPFAVGLGHVEQRARDAAVDVQQRQRLDLPVGIAQALHQAAHDGVATGVEFSGRQRANSGAASTSMSVWTSARTVAECGSLSIRLISPT